MFPPLLEGFDKYVEQVMRRWHIPGAAIGVVDNGKVIYVKAFGHRHAEEDTPVTTETLFPIGSNTKSFTATGLGMLVDDGKLEWDAPVRRYLPRFQLSDELAGARATTRDLLTHRTGVPGHIATFHATRKWLDAHLTRRKVMQGLAHIKPSAGFREKYQYNNEMYIITGLLFEATGNKTWEQFTQERILDPLGMKSTYLHYREVPPSSNIALGHIDRSGKGTYDSIGHYTGSLALGPAGSMISNVPDMLTWLLFHVNRGRHKDRQLLSENSANQLVRPQVQLPDVDPPQHVGGFYGMGFMIFADSARRKWIQHAGNASDCTSLIGFVPAERDGMVILTNWANGMSYSPLMAIALNLRRRLLNQSTRDYIETYYSIDTAQRESQRKELRMLEARRQPDTTPSHKLEEYAGHYYHPAFQLFEVFVEDGCLKYRFHGVTKELTHYHYDVFRVDLFGARFATFRYNRFGTIDRVLLDFVPNVSEIEFVRKKDAQ